MVKLPTPLYVVFYNGIEPMEDKVFLNLSDAFMHPPCEGSYEWTAIRKAMDTAINKNYLDGFFQKEKEMIFMTTLYEIDKDVYERDLREDAKSSFSSLHPLPRNRSAK